MKALLGWIGRTGLLYLVLCLAIGFYLLAWPRIAPQFSTESFRQDAMSIAEMRAEIEGSRAALQGDLEQRETRIRRAGMAEIEQRLREARRRRDALQAELDRDDGLFPAIRPSTILARKKRELRAAALDAEIAALDEGRRTRIAGEASDTARRTLQRIGRIPTQEAVRVSYRLCDDARAAVAAFERRTELDRDLREIFLRERQRLTGARDTRCDAAERRDAARRRGLEARQAYADAQGRLEAARSWTMQRLPDTARDLSGVSMRDILVQAALALLAILLAPFAIRTILYYVLAPLAERAGGIRIANPARTDGRAPPLSRPAAKAEGSRSSIALSLDDRREVLVRQGYFQSSQAGAQTATRWLLSWRSPLVSLASGMAFLTRVRGAGTVTTVSATQDPFAEVDAIEIAEGAAIVLQPRALAAAIQPLDRPLRITSHWRLFNPNAWLTLQLRFLLFHGPCTLVVRGGRGVRIEPVETGRIFGQDQMVGFSDTVAYSVRRNETFAPYLFGRAPLFRDRVQGGSGILVIEEAPLAGRRKGIRRGLEDTLDAVLKAFGI